MSGTDSIESVFFMPTMVRLDDATPISDGVGKIFIEPRHAIAGDSSVRFRLGEDLTSHLSCDVGESKITSLKTVG